ncbi:hypothetical protein HPB49_014175 [Dermacentor silvarum]|uniref:Uncharacterized protein n=1 Tax=Dermacentor silvarum TaxID=543639 RepID=A0ACB8DPP8_DERSI|nr:hypothetical protein HPB49_014175 [Dermacentor silvarum]
MAGTRPVQLPVDAVDQTAARPAGAFFGTAITNVELPDSADDSTVTEMDSDSSSFTPVESRRLKRKLRRTSTAGEAVMDRPAPVQRPTKAQCFLFNVPVSTPVDAIIDSVEEVVGAGGLQYLQHHGGNKFLAAVRSAAQAAKMAAKGSLLLANKIVPLERMGTAVVYVTVYRLPPCVSDDVLTAALAPYGKCRGISDVVFKDRTDISNGSRLVKLEMVKPPPNFIMVTGFRVMLEYKGMKRV